MKKINGDLIADFKNKKIDVIMHQCNCTVGLGAGFARYLANEYTELDLLDFQMRNKYKEKIFGDFTYLNVGETQTIVNLYSQFNAGSPKEHTTDDMENRLNALFNSFAASVEDLDLYNSKIGIPLIASDLGADKVLKGNLTSLEYFEKYVYPTIEPIIIKYKLDVTVYYL